MNRKMNFASLFVVLALALVLSACGNGGLKASAPAAASPTPTVSSAAPTGLLTCTTEQVVFWGSNGYLKGGIDCYKADGTLLSAKTSDTKPVAGPVGPESPVGPEGPMGPAGPAGKDGKDGKDAAPATAAPVTVNVNVNQNQIVTLGSGSNGQPVAVTALPDSTGSLTPTTALTQTSVVSYVQLNYDKNPAYKGDCMDDTDLAADPKVTGQAHYPAYLVCIANAAGRNQADLEAVIVGMQADAASSGAKTLVGKVITLPNDSAWFVWIPNATGFDYSLVPNDTAYPSGLVHPALGQFWIVPAYAAGINGRTFTSTTAEFWAVALK